MPIVNGRVEAAAAAAAKHAMRALGDDQSRSAGDLRSEMVSLAGRRRAGEAPESLLAPVLALGAEAIRRCHGQLPREAVIHGGATVALGAVAPVGDERDGVLAAGMAAVWHAMEGQGAHLITLDDDEARVASEVLAPIAAALGMTTGAIGASTGASERRTAYALDVTVGSYLELATDRLRDDLRRSRSELMQRGLHAAVVASGDRLLVESAVVTVHLTVPSREPASVTPQERELAGRLRRDVDYRVSREHGALRFAPGAIPELKRVAGWGDGASAAAVASARRVEWSLLQEEGLSRGADELVGDISVQAFARLYGSLGAVSAGSPAMSAALTKVYGLSTAGARRSVWDRFRATDEAGPHPDFLAMERVVDRHRETQAAWWTEIRDGDPGSGIRDAVLKLVDGWGVDGSTSDGESAEQLAESARHALEREYGAMAATATPDVIRDERLSILDTHRHEHLRDLRFLQRQAGPLYLAVGNVPGAFASDADRLLAASRQAMRADAVAFLRRWTEAHR